MPFIMLAKDAPGFGDVNHPKPMLLTPNDPDATIVLADIALSSIPFSQNLGAVLLEQGCKILSFDLHVQLFAPIHTAIHITGAGGGGVISNTWVWAGDHNFTTNDDMTPVLNAATHWEGALSGIRIDSKGKKGMNDAFWTLLLMHLHSVEYIYTYIYTHIHIYIDIYIDIYIGFSCEPFLAT